MKHIPIAFPLLFVLIIGATFFAGAYAIAEGAAVGQVQASVADGGSSHIESEGELEWYQSAAVLVCPLH